MNWEHADVAAIALPPDPTVQGTKTPSTLEAVAHDFEALFYNQLFKAMRQTVGSENAHSFGNSVFSGMLDEQFARHAATTTGLGLSRLLIDEFGEK